MEAPKASSDDTPQSSEHYRSPQIPSLGELIVVLGFEELGDDTVKILEDEILDENLRDEAKIKTLLHAYEDLAGKIIQETNGGDWESLGLILKKAHFLYVKGMYAQLLEVSFSNLNDVLKSPEFNDATYNLVGNTMTAIRAEVARLTD